MLIFKIKLIKTRLQLLKMSVKSEEMKALPPKISNLDLTKNDILQDDLKRDQLLEKSYREVKKEMDDCTNTPFNAFDYATKTHKDPVNEAKVYLAKQDVIQIFKVIVCFQIYI